MTILNDGVTVDPDGHARALYDGEWTDLDHLDVTIDDPGDLPSALCRRLAVGGALAAGVWAGAWFLAGWHGVIALLAAGVLTAGSWLAYEAIGSRFEEWREQRH